MPMISSSVRASVSERRHACMRGRVGDVHGFVASGDAGKDVDLAADFRADEAGGQADAPLTVADDGHLREEPTGVCAPVRTDEGALVGASQGTGTRRRRRCASPTSARRRTGRRFRTGQCA